MADSRDITDKALFLRHFDCVGDFYQWLRETPSPWKCGLSSTREGDSRFKGTSSYQEADTLAAEGWKEGRERLDSSLKDAARAVSMQSPPSQWLDVAGAYPIVPVAVSGDNESMVNFGDVQRAQKPVIRFSINVRASAMVSTDTIMARGAAILSWVDSLESSGFRCEIELVDSGTSDGTTTAARIILKRAQDALDVDKAAYAIVHPSFLRRHCFAFIERSPFEKTQSSGYGIPADVEPEANQIYFGRMLGSEPQWNNPKDAAAYVKAQIEAGGFTLD